MNVAHFQLKLELIIAVNTVTIWWGEKGLVSVENMATDVQSIPTSTHTQSVSVLHIVTPSLNLSGNSSVHTPNEPVS